VPNVEILDPPTIRSLIEKLDLVIAGPKQLIRDPIVQSPESDTLKPKHAEFLTDNSPATIKSFFIDPIDPTTAQSPIDIIGERKQVPADKQLPTQPD
jgi:hypothetical protein